MLTADNLSSTGPGQIINETIKASQNLDYQGMVLFDEEGKEVWSDGFFKTFSFNSQRLSKLRENDLVDIDFFKEFNDDFGHQKRG